MEQSSTSVVASRRLSSPRTTLAEVQALAARNRVSRCGNGPNEYEPTRVQAAPWRECHLAEIDHSRAFIRSPIGERVVALQRVGRGTMAEARRPLSSYSWKHACEVWRGEGCLPGQTYVSNGAFIVAAYLEGLKPRRIFYTDDVGRRRTINSTIRLP